MKTAILMYISYRAHVEHFCLKFVANIELLMTVFLYISYYNKKVRKSVSVSQSVSHAPGALRVPEGAGPVWVRAMIG